MKKRLLYLNFDDFSSNELCEQLTYDVVAGNKKVCTFVNLDLLRMSYYDSAFKKMISDSDYCIVDGKPLIWLSKMFRYGVKYKNSGSDMANYLLATFANTNLHVLIVGGKEGVADKAQENVNFLYGKNVVTDTICPPFGFEKDKTLTSELVDLINKSNAECVFLCLGAPKQEMFFQNHKELLGDKVYICLGATVDFLANTVKRAPKWMSKIGLEWLYRLLQEPRRLFSRYFKDFIFLNKIIFIRLFNKKKIERMKNE